MGYDRRPPRALGEVGREGTAVSTLADMIELFDGIDLGAVTTSMTVNCSASIVLACTSRWRSARACRSRRSAAPSRRHAEGVHRQKEWISPPVPSVRVIVDMIEFCTPRGAALPPGLDLRLPHPRKPARRRCRRSPSRFADGIGYVVGGARPRPCGDDFAPRLSFFFNLHNDFLEEVAKLRAARRLWARIMRDRFGATSPRSLMLRTHAQTAGCSLTAQQPSTTWCGSRSKRSPASWGACSRCTRTRWTKPWRCRARQAVMVALRTQQIIAEESA